MTLRQLMIIHLEDEKVLVVALQIIAKLLAVYATDDEYADDYDYDDNEDYDDDEFPVIDDKPTMKDWFYLLLKGTGTS